MRCLERQGKATQHNRKTKQHNITHPKQLFFKEKLAASGGTRIHDTRVLGNVYLIPYTPGSVAAADGHCEAVPEAPGRHPAAGSECTESGHSGE